MKDLLSIRQEGFCSNCRRWQPLGKGESWLPKHTTGKNGERCPNSLYSYANLRFIIGTPAEASAVARFILRDKGKCLEGGVQHSMRCGDGNHCAETRLLWAQALARYYLKKKLARSKQKRARGDSS